MQWKNHRITTFAVTFALTGSFPATAIATAASALPDVLEMKLLKHRALTHYPWLPLVPALFAWKSMQNEASYILYVGFFILIGYIGHLAADFLGDSGIPVWVGKRIGMHLYVTHTRSEDIVARVVLAVAMFYVWEKGMITQSYLMEAADNTALFVTGMVRHFSRV